MNNTLLIFFGAGLGGVFRFWISRLMYWCLGSQFPYGTLVVNVTGSLLMGFLYVLIIERMDGIAPQLRALLLIGFLGGYTTFSSFAIETLNLYDTGAWLAAGINILGSVGLSLAAVALGVLGARQL